jgi:hypothetical protein
MKTSTSILKYLNEEGRSGELPLNVLREFQEFEKGIAQEMKSYDELPSFAAYAMKSFTKIEMFCLALMLEKYPEVLNCHKDVMNLFGKDEAFDDGITVSSWIYFNFPVEKNGEAIASLALKQLTPEIASVISPFVTEMLNSRLGLYEVIYDRQESCQLKELFTGKEVILSQTLGGARRGAISLVRVFSVEGENYIFGHSSEWPANKKAQLLGMVEAKMSLYFPNKDIIKSYEAMMRIAGPYWFSIVGSDCEGDILNPDYCFKFYKKH